VGQSGIVQDFFLGWETLMRGYSAFSFDQFRECRTTTPEFSFCPAYERLFGQRIAVMNAEARVPLIGTDRYGLVDFGFIPTEVGAFVDAGLAWSGSSSPVLEWSKDSSERIPVVSAGFTSRFNLFGAFILEVYYAYPFQRPEKGAHWGFQLAPGW
jgi:outer membrane protein assembly factor BamA